MNLHDVCLYHPGGLRFTFVLSDEDWTSVKASLHNEKSPRFIEVYCHDAGTTCGIRVDEYIMYEEREAF